MKKKIEDLVFVMEVEPFGRVKMGKPRDSLTMVLRKSQAVNEAVGRKWQGDEDIRKTLRELEARNDETSSMQQGLSDLMQAMTTKQGKLRGRFAIETAS